MNHAGQAAGEPVSKPDVLSTRGAPAATCVGDRHVRSSNPDPKPTCQRTGSRVSQTVLCCMCHGPAIPSPTPLSSAGAPPHRSGHYPPSGTLRRSPKPGDVLEAPPVLHPRGCNLSASFSSPTSKIIVSDPPPPPPPVDESKATSGPLTRALPPPPIPCSQSDLLEIHTCSCPTPR